MCLPKEEVHHYQTAKRLAPCPLVGNTGKVRLQVMRFGECPCSLIPSPPSKEDLQLMGAMEVMLGRDHERLTPIGLRSIALALCSTKAAASPRNLVVLHHGLFGRRGLMTTLDARLLHPSAVRFES